MTVANLRHRKARSVPRGKTRGVKKTQAIAKVLT
jgi:hypothetical protein